MKASTIITLVDYAQRLGVGAVVRRLSYLLEHFGMADASALEPLRDMLTAQPCLGQG